MPRMPEDERTTAPRSGLLARVRRFARYVPFHRLYHSIEISLIILFVAVVDVALGDLGATRALLAFLVPAALVSLVGHFVAIVNSSRLRT